MRSPSDERTKCLVRQICDQNLHAATNTTLKHSEVEADVLNTVKENASDKMSDCLKSLSMLLQYLLNKPYEIMGFFHPIFFQEMQIICPLVYYC